MSFRTAAVLLLVSAAALLSESYFVYLELPTLEIRYRLHHEILEATAQSPYRYRVLVPFLVEGLARTVFSPLQAFGPFAYGYVFYDLLALSAMLVALYAWLRTWYSESLSLIGALFAAISTQIALQDHVFQPWSLLEAATFPLAFIAIHRERYGWFLAITAVASFNRETAVFLPLALFLMKVDFRAPTRIDRRALAFAALAFAIWLAIYLGLREWRGHAPSVESIGRLLARNLETLELAKAALNVFLLLGLGWLLLVPGYRVAPEPLRRVTMLLPFYLAPVLLFGVWAEVRLLMPMYPILVGLLVAALATIPRETSTPPH